MWQIISAYIEVLITIIGVIIFARIVLDKKIEKSQAKFIISFVLVSIIYLILYLNITGVIKSLLMCLANVIFCKYTFNIKYGKAIFLIIIDMIVLIIPDLLELVFVTKILGLSKEFCYETFASSIISNLVVCILLIIITYLLRKILRKIINIEIENNIKIIIFSILTFISTLMFFYTMIKEYKFGENILLYLVAIAVLLIVLSSLIRQTLENKKLTDKYDKLLEFMTGFEKEIEKNRVLRHETKNNYITIKAKIIDKEKNKKILAYIDSLINEKSDIKNELYAKFGYLPANGIKGLCYFKTKEAEDKGLNININISKRIEKSFIYNLNNNQIKDLGKILGVFLDNAIEASVNSQDKNFSIEAYLSLDNKKCEFIICNSYDNIINIEKMGKERFSTKGKNRGHGLMLVNHLIKKNKIFTLKTELINGLYIQNLTIKESIND